MFASPASAFTDTTDHWARYDIDLLSSRYFLGGYPDGTFRPQKNITRAETVKVLLEISGLEPYIWSLKDQKSTFKDVSDAYWAKVYLEGAYEAGILLGYEDGTARPENPISRAELAVLLIRTLDLTAPPQGSLSFSDNQKILSWAKKEVAQAAALDLVRGFEDWSFRPQNNTTRAEATAMFSRWLKLNGDRFEAQGKIKKIDLANKKITIENSGQEISFFWAEDLLVYAADGTLILPQNLKPAIPVYFNLNKAGKLNFIQVLEENPPPLNFSLQKEELSSTVVDYSIPKVAALDFLGPLEPKETPSNSMELCLKETRVDKLRENKKVSGKGELIALIDTGIDPLHPDLLKTPSGENKIVDFIDLTEEGKIFLHNSLNAGGSQYKIEGRTYNLSGISSVGGIYRYGFIEEAALDKDLNFNDQKNDRFLVVATASAKPNVFDTIYIDLNNDGYVGNEKPLFIYTKNYQRLSFPADPYGASFNFVVSSIDPAGNYVSLGFDANGHGTHLAGIISAAGELEGFAPESKLLVIKALNQKGETDFATLKNAMELAAARGADVVNLSLGYYPDKTAGQNSLTLTIDNLNKKYGTIFVAAGGNNGPGLNTLATPGNGNSVISAGAYFSPSLWNEIFGYDVSADSLWPYSSVGPRQDGYLSPLVLAPGSITSCAPLWSGAKYYNMEGTSVASAEISATIALLLEAAQKEGLKVTLENLKLALAEGSTATPQFLLTEGKGKLNALGAWNYLDDLAPPQVLSNFYNPLFGSGMGLMAREFLPARLDFTLKNEEQKDLKIHWEAMADWVEPIFKNTTLPEGAMRTFPLNYNLPSDPGVYQTLLVGREVEKPFRTITIPLTVIKPLPLTKDLGYHNELAGKLAPAEHKRYFFRVPSDTAVLELTLEARDKGRVCFFLFKPDGTLAKGSEEYIGKNCSSAAESFYLENPFPGTWEIVVTSAPDLSFFGLEQSEYQLTFNLNGVQEKNETDQSWLIGISEKGIEDNGYLRLTLHIWDAKDLQPVKEGRIIVNGLLYQIRQGKAKVKVVPSEPLVLEKVF